MRRLAIILPLLLLTSCGNEDGGKPEFAVSKTYAKDEATLRLKASADTITVADRIQIVLEAEAAEGVEVTFPEQSEKLGEFTVVEGRTTAPELAAGNRTIVRRVLTLEPFLPGDYEVPPLEVRFGTDAVVRTEAVPVKVASVLPDSGEQPELKEIAPPVELPGFSPWWYAATLVLLAAAGVWIWLRRRRKSEKAEALPLPHEIALRALRELLDEDLVGKGEAKLFYLRVSGILRRYIEGRFGLQAPERTTEEFLQDLRTDHTLNERQKTLLKEFLNHCDMVKFAEYQPRREEIDNTINSCAQFIAETKPAREEAGGTRTATEGRRA